MGDPGSQVRPLGRPLGRFLQELRQLGLAVGDLVSAHLEASVEQVVVGFLGVARAPRLSDSPEALSCGLSVEVVAGIGEVFWRRFIEGLACTFPNRVVVGFDELLSVAAFLHATGRAGLGPRELLGRDGTPHRQRGHETGRNESESSGHARHDARSVQTSTTNVLRFLLLVHAKRASRGT